VNMLYIESPVGVGFSYSDTNDYKCDDDRTASENMAAVEAFFGMFPEYKLNKFFITGESYAGVYVPTLAEAIVNAEKAGTYTGAKLTGLAAGNGCSGTQVGICGDGTQGTYYEWQYLLQTAFVSTDLKNKVNSACDWDAAAKNEKGALSLDCVRYLNDASAQISHVNLYNIYGDW
jgi:carboxypeptidase C (cathepsin A)